MSNTLRSTIRCVNLDWLEVYCLEDFNAYPVDADYFKLHGYQVQRREYGTRQYLEMFTICGEDGQPWLEVRRHPASGDSKFNGLEPQSCHIRLVNRACYFTDAVSRLRDFLALHNYTFKRIFRVDVCLDFETFDYGDRPEAFAQRYLNKRYAKMNQVQLSTHAREGWASFDWETLSWGSRTSSVSTKLYNKTRELQNGPKDKPYIKYCWFLAGLVDDPISYTKRGSDGKPYTPDIWRLEFSIKSKVDRFLLIEDIAGKKVKKRAVANTLDLYDSPDKLWQRFEELAFHYFRFKHVEYKDTRRGLAAPMLEKNRTVEGRERKRKDRCADKPLFRFNTARDYLHITNLPNDTKKAHGDDILRRRLQMYRSTHADLKIRQACDVILQEIMHVEELRHAARPLSVELEAMQRAIQLRMGGSTRETLELAAEIKQLLEEGTLF